MGASSRDFETTKKSRIIVRDDPTELAATAAHMFSAAAQKSVKDRGRFVAALSGGTTPLGIFRILPQAPYGSEVPWDKMSLFWVDERCVPEDDPESNYGAARKYLLDRVPIPRSQVFPMPGTSPPEAGAREYQRVLTEFFHLKGDRFPVFDLIFLGVGGDGHIASLFPGHTALDEEEKPVVAVKGGNPYVSRLTLTVPVLNRAREVVFLVSGKQKARVVSTVFEDPQARLPAQRIRSLDGETVWLLDREAAALLPRGLYNE
jgi:6-phosphogluconolactonase